MQFKSEFKRAFVVSFQCFNDCFKRQPII